MDGAREYSRPACRQHHRLRREQPRHPHKSRGLQPKREWVSRLEQGPERLEGRCCPQVDRYLLPITIRRLLVNDVDVETGQTSACSCGIDLALSTVRPLRHGPLPPPCTGSITPGTYLPRLACSLSLIIPGNESSETCDHGHGRCVRKDR